MHSENTMNEAAIMIQKAVRYWKQRKSYKELYEKRKWTLHKEGNVLTNHVGIIYLFIYCIKSFNLKIIITH